MGIILGSLQVPSKDKGRKQQWKLTAKLRAKRQARRNRFENRLCPRKLGAEEFRVLRREGGTA
jgi:hypothetical protein